MADNLRKRMKDSHPPYLLTSTHAALVPKLSKVSPSTVLYAKPRRAEPKKDPRSKSMRGGDFLTKLYHK